MQASLAVLIRALFASCTGL